MSTYYELLAVPPSAPTAEIQAAFDVQYEQWRRMVTHHDPNVVNQANQAIQLLEKMRATLTDPAKRTVYDEAIGVSKVGGLADPGAVLKMPQGTMTPPPPSARASAKIPAQEASTSKLWACQRCGEKNPEHTQFCYNCGAQLVRECPKCRKNTSLLATGFCGSCGANVDETTKRIETRQRLSNEWSALEKQRAVFLNEAQALDKQGKSVSLETQDITVFVLVAGGLYVLGGVFVIVVLSLSRQATLGGIVLFLLASFGAFFAGTAVFAIGIVVRKRANARRDAEATELWDLAAAKKNEARRLETPLLKLKEQIQELSI